MSKKKKLAVLVLLLLLLGANIWLLLRPAPVGGDFELKLDVKGENQEEIQIFYNNGNTPEFSEIYSQKNIYEGNGQWQELTFTIANDTSYLRFDFGNTVGSCVVKEIRISGGDEEIQITGMLLNELLEDKEIDLTEGDKEDEVFVTSQGTDAHAVLQVNLEDLRASQYKEAEFKNTIIKVLVTLALDLGALVIFIFRKKIGMLPVELYQNRKLILKLAQNDFKTKYAGSYLGIVWAFVQPVVTIMVYWFVFSVGFRTGSVEEYPFVLYLVTGIIPWFLFQDALNGGTNALIEYNYLVKKVVFKISILPIVKMVSAYFVHVFFVLFALVICIFMGYLPSIYWLQILYYDFCIFLFTLGLVYATSAIVIFFRDLTQIISIFLQVGVWMTPIMWDFNMLANYPALQILFKLNPMYYVVTGYRDSILGKVSMLAHWQWGAGFWLVTALLFIVGTVVFKRLKPHFADVL